jgi:2-dehydro-3-deoxygluconokinase
VPVSFDVNYRSRLWTPKAAREFLFEIAPRLTYLFIGADDAQAVLELPAAPEPALAGLRAVAPRAIVALTLGEAGSAVAAGDRIVRPSRLYTVVPVDRVGAGDAYAAGFLWAMSTGRGIDAAVDAATALAALKCTIWGDVALVSRAELEELLASDDTEIRR